MTNNSILVIFDKTIFDMLLSPNETIAEIAKEAAKLDPLEQQILLTKLRVKRLKKKGAGVVANASKDTRKPTLKQIDKWKHEAKAKS
ncbi:MAG: hypothetical protein ABI921_03375 [Panacibacter sp.]